MTSNDERPAVMRGLLVLFVLVILTVVVPELGYVLLGLVIALVLGVIVGLVALLRPTRADQHRPVRRTAPITQSVEREVA